MLRRAVDPANRPPPATSRTRSCATASCSTYQRARAAGRSDAAFVALIEELDAAVARVDGRGFAIRR